ncbi:hypothetical protein [Glycomyces artemisiae]|uniref:Uncharacterized protein n=1 Tax=Glycomyces artemisiae TaxID=1076443 RepID=A0A2T0UEW7_9ACTN|nr:hypothetical protein [Glycomyces artemisiae]PRY56463.1 hypothetical protein B0I28_109112 [Glycomyces artemisiae]
MRVLNIDYKERRRRDGRPEGLLNRGITVFDVPRPVLRCRLRGHKPVIDGTGTVGQPGHLSRWVVCDRCDTRPEPQGRLHATGWDIGEPYPKPGDIREAAPGETNPGPWPEPVFEFHTQVLIGGAGRGFSAEFKVGNRGSENALGGHLSLWRLFGIYWSTGEFGRGIQRRLNPTGYESKVIEVSAYYSRIYWKLWADRDDNRLTSRWRAGSVRWRPLDLLLGEKHYPSEDIGDPVASVLVMPEGDRHRIALQLVRVDVKRRKRTRAKFHAWRVEWKTETGIPTMPGGRGTVLTASIRIDHANPASSAWALDALDAIRTDLAEARAARGYTSTPEDTTR